MAPGPLLLAHLLAWSASALAPHVLVVGGSGRVGGSTCRALLQRGVRVSVGGRDAAALDRERARWQRLEPLTPGIDTVSHVRLDIDADDTTALADALKGYDAVVHTAGPFQFKERPAVLAAAAAARVPYCDCCDDIGLGRKAVAAHGEAMRAAGVPAVVCAGTWPGVSSLLAARLCDDMAEAGKAVDAVDFSFFTAGSGGAGKAVLAATFLILSEAAQAYEGGVATSYPPGSDTRQVDFGRLGSHEVYRMNLLEAVSAHEFLGAATTSTRFATAPGVWNKLLRGVAELAPKALLRDRAAMGFVAAFSEPIVRFVDGFVGSANGIRCDVTSADKTLRLSALHTHPDLEACVGLAIAAFVDEILAGGVPPGVHFPEQLPAAARARIIEAASLEDDGNDLMYGRFTGGGQ